MFVVYGTTSKLCLQAVAEYSVGTCVAVLLVHSPAALYNPLLFAMQGIKLTLTLPSCRLAVDSMWQQAAQGLWQPDKHQIAGP